MPASLLADMNSHSGGLEDQRALQLALELSMLGLAPEDGGDGGSPVNSNNMNPAPFDMEEKAMALKRSANMTECVPVPSSEHVAEIVGRQGCKIKALRAKTNTYIKTPVRGEEPVFVVTGRKDDVVAAKREILSAAEHFSQIRASRRNNSNSAGGVGGVLAPGPPSPTTPGQVTIQVRVPYRVVGLVVGPKGATIKRIQQQTHTYIVTPSRDKEPVFEVTGTPENVDKARQEIEGHIAMRTGGALMDANNANHVNGAATGAPSAEDAHLNQLNDFHSNGIDSGFHDMSNDLISSLYKPPSSNSAFTSYSSASNNSNNLLSHRNQDSNIFTFPQINGSSSKLAEFNMSTTNGFTSNGFGIYENDEGIASPTFDPAPAMSAVWSDLGDNRNGFTGLFGLQTTATSSPSASLPRRSSSMSSSTTPRLSPTPTESNGSPTHGETTPTEHNTVRRIRSDPLSGGLSSMTTFTPLPANPQNFGSTSSDASVSSSTSTSPTESTGSSGTGSATGLGNGPTPPRPRRNCMMCNESLVVAALVPCGHNLFCMDCANNVVEKPMSDRRCPVCQQPPSQAIRIFS